MKKMLVLIASAFVLSVSLAGCAGQNTETPDTGDKSVVVSDEPTESAAAEITASLLAGEESKNADSSEAPEEIREPTADNVPQTRAASPSETKAPSQTAEAPAPKHEATPPATEQPKQETPKPPTTSPPETEKPIPTQPPAPSFDVNAYVAYAQSYGQGIGLSLDSTATACWDDPLHANAGCTYLERDLKDRLDWYQASGFTEFWVWSENIGNGAYQIYIGYA